MRYLVLISVMLASGVQAQSSPIKPGPDDGRVIVAVEDSINAAWLKHDTVTLRRLIGSDFIGYTSSGRRVDQAAMLRQAASASESTTVVSDRTTRVFGNVGVTTSLITDSGTRLDGTTFTVTARVTNVFLLRARRWQLVANQETLTSAAR